MLISLARGALAVAVLVAGTCVPITASANDRALEKPKQSRAREHLAQGNMLYKVREFEKAVAEYKAGAVLEDASVFDYNLAQSYRQLGKYSEAIWHYQRVLNYGRPGGELRKFITDIIEQMNAELQRLAMKQPPTGIAPEVVEPTSRTPAPPPLGRLSSSEEPRAVRSSWYADPLGWGLVGAGVLGGGSAGLLLMSASGQRDDANMTTIENRRLELHGSADRLERISAVTGIAAGACLLAGVIKLAIHDSGRSPPRTTAWSFGASHRGVIVFGSF